MHLVGLFIQLITMHGLYSIQILSVSFLTYHYCRPDRRALCILFFLAFQLHGCYWLGLDCSLSFFPVDQTAHIPSK